MMPEHPQGAVLCILILGGNLIVAIIKKQPSGLVRVEEYREADTITDALLSFCLENNPVLDVNDYIGAGVGNMDLKHSWGWDFDDESPKLIEVVQVLGELSTNVEVADVVRIYERRSDDGRHFFEEKRALLYLDLVNNVITPEEAFFIESKLKPVKDMVLTGDWLTAQSIANSLTVEGAYNQTYHDNLTGYIDNYVSQNYDI
jgi:hypothetical protein